MKLQTNFLFICILVFFSGCAPSSKVNPQRCSFNVVVQGYDNQHLTILDDSNVIYESKIGVSEKVTEISDWTSFSLVTPTEIKIEVQGKKLRKLKIPNCQKLGIVINGLGHGVRLIHMDNFLFN